MVTSNKKVDSEVCSEVRLSYPVSSFSSEDWVKSNDLKLSKVCPKSEEIDVSMSKMKEEKYEVEGKKVEVEVVNSEVQMQKVKWEKKIINLKLK